MLDPFVERRLYAWAPWLTFVFGGHVLLVVSLGVVHWIENRNKK
jgi:hypothetical protein